MDSQTSIIIENEVWKEFIAQTEIAPLDKLDKEHRRKIIDEWNMHFIAQKANEYNVSEQELANKLKQIYQIQFNNQEISETLQILGESLETIITIIDEGYIKKEEELDRE